MFNEIKVFKNKYVLSILVVVLLFVSLIAYGKVKYSDPPTHKCANNLYCSELGKSYTVAEYDDYVEWQGITYFSGRIGFLIVIFLWLFRNPGKYR